MGDLLIRKHHASAFQVAQWSALAVLLAAAFYPQSITGINIFDEGFIVSGAMLILDGKLPYRDFLSMYGPGQYYLSAGIFALFGEALIFIRYLHVILLAALGLILYALARVSGASSRWATFMLFGYTGIVLFVKPNAGYPAITATLFLLLGAFFVTRWASTTRTSQIAYASSMIGLAGLFRWDFGAFGLITLVATVAIATITAELADERRRALSSKVGAALAPALIILAIAYIPLLIFFSDPIRWLVEVPVFSIAEFKKWRNLEFVGPALEGLFAGSARSFLSSTLRLAYLGVPVILVAGALATALRSLRFRGATRPNKTKIVLMVYLGLLTLFLLNQMRVRPSLWQGFPALVTSLTLIVILFDHHYARIRRFVPLTKIALGAGVIAIGVLLLRAELGDIFLSAKHIVRFDTPKTDGIFVERGRQSYAELVNYIHQNTNSGDLIYSGVKDHSRLFVNDAMLYFLVDRAPADRFLELEPGISNTHSGQQEIINALASKQVKLIVLSGIHSNEPNLTSKSNGITILDDFIRANYRHVRDFGSQAVFVHK